jgi:hypothetical protein
MAAAPADVRATAFKTLQVFGRPPPWRRQAAAAALLTMGKRGLVTFLHSERWTKEAAEGVQFTVGNGY